MKRSLSPLTLNESKIQASILFKSLHSENTEQQQQALMRFRHCPESAYIKPQALKRKHVLEVIAFEQGFDSWATLKLQICLIKGGFLNHWFSRYEEAKTFQNAHGGFLLPYKKQFFICTAEYILALGFNPDDPSWRLIHYDGANPKKKNIFRRLCHV